MIRGVLANSSLEAGFGQLLVWAGEAVGQIPAEHVTRSFAWNQLRNELGRTGTDARQQLLEECIHGASLLSDHAGAVQLLGHFEQLDVARIDPRLHILQLNANLPPNQNIR